MNDLYYTLDTALFHGRFRHFGEESVAVRAKVHQSEERYSLPSEDRDVEPLTTLWGIRSYVHLRPFVLVPDATLTMNLYTMPVPTGTIGKVLGVYERKMKEVEIGQAQAWYYPQDSTIVLWECFFHEFVSDGPLIVDQNMRNLWKSFTHFLQSRYPDATRITTPFHDPLFRAEEYQAFLRSLGYEQIARAAYGKSITRS